MAINHRKIINLPVFTKSKTRVGYITGFDVDELEQRIVSYYVKTHQGLVSIFDKELLISPRQVISIDKEKMIVDDATVKASAEKKDRAVSKKAIPLGS